MKSEEKEERKKKGQKWKVFYKNNFRMAVLPRLEELCVNSYLSYLEHEAAAYVSLTQSDSRLLRSIASNMITILKNQLSKFIGSNMGVISVS